MKLRILGRSFEISRISAIGLSLVIIGIILLALAYAAQSEIDEIGSTNDPVLQNRIITFENQRDTLLMTAIGILFLGMFVLFVLKEKSTPLSVSEAQMISTAKMTNEIISGLSLTGNASYLPAHHGLTKEKLFIPAPRNSMIPPVALSDDLTISPGKDGSTPGMLVRPPGASLIDYVEKELDTTFDGIGFEPVESMLQILKHGLGMMRDFHLKERDGKIVMRVEYNDLLDACRTIKKENPDTCRQIACVGCSCLLTAMARATGKIVRIEDVDNLHDRVVFTLELREW